MEQLNLTNESGWKDRQRSTAEYETEIHKLKREIPSITNYLGFLALRYQELTGETVDLHQLLDKEQPEPPPTAA